MPHNRHPRSCANKEDALAQGELIRLQLPMPDQWRLHAGTTALNYAGDWDWSLRRGPIRLHVYKGRMSPDMEYAAGIEGLINTWTGKEVSPDPNKAIATAVETFRRESSKMLASIANISRDLDEIYPEPAETAADE